jgi:hypothetical protein
MDSTNLQLFKHSATDVAMPTIDVDKEAEQKKLISGDISGAILGDEVKKLILPESSVISEENFIFDFSASQTITVFQKEALKSLISSDGTISLYLYKKNGLVEFGKGEKYSLERMIPLVRHFIFNDEISIYKNYQPGQVAKSVVSRDITKMRLNL